jgi:hypothetical protein
MARVSRIGPSFQTPLNSRLLPGPHAVVFGLREAGLHIHIGQTERSAHHLLEEIGNLVFKHTLIPGRLLTAKERAQHYVRPEQAERVAI